MYCVYRNPWCSFAISKDSFYHFFSFLIDCFIPFYMSDIFCFFLYIFPKHDVLSLLHDSCFPVHLDICGHFTLISTAFIFSVSIPVCCTVSLESDFLDRCNNPIVFIINIFIFLKKSLFCHRVVYMEMVQSYLSEVVCIAGVCILLHLPRSFLVQNFSVPFHRLFEMFGYIIHFQDEHYIHDPSVFITCRFCVYAKTCLCSPFAKPSAFWICNTALLVFISHLVSVQAHCVDHS